MGSLHRRGVLAFSIAIWAMSAVLYAHLHHWKVFDAGIEMGSGMATKLESTDFEGFSLQIELLEKKEVTAGENRTKEDKRAHSP